MIRTASPTTSCNRLYVRNSQSGWPQAPSSVSTIVRPATSSQHRTAQASPARFKIPTSRVRSITIVCIFNKTTIKLINDAEPGPSTTARTGRSRLCVLLRTHQRHVPAIDRPMIFSSPPENCRRPLLASSPCFPESVHRYAVFHACTLSCLQRNEKASALTVRHDTSDSELSVQERNLVSHSNALLRHDVLPSPDRAHQMAFRLKERSHGLTREAFVVNPVDHRRQILS